MARKIKTEANLAAVPIDGEAYTIGRYYKLRYSSAKILSTLQLVGAYTYNLI